MSNKRTYGREFKLQAVALAKSSGKSISVIERELGIMLLAGEMETTLENGRGTILVRDD